MFRQNRIDLVSNAQLYDFMKRNCLQTPPPPPFFFKFLIRTFEALTRKESFIFYYILLLLLNRFARPCDLDRGRSRFLRFESETDWSKTKANPLILVGNAWSGMQITTAKHHIHIYPNSLSGPMTGSCGSISSYFLSVTSTKINIFRHDFFFFSLIPARANWWH